MVARPFRDVVLGEDAFLRGVVVGDGKGHDLFKVQAFVPIGLVQALRHHGWRDTEAGGHVLGGRALVDQDAKGFELVGGVHVVAHHVLGEAFSGKGARELAADALTKTVLSWRDDARLQARGMFRGFEILSRGRKTTSLLSGDEENLPELFVRGAGIYKAQMNAENPLGTMQSIEYALRGLDKAVMEERERLARDEQMLADFQEQAGRPFEHEARLKDLLTRQAALNAALDLDKGERQAAPPDGTGNDLEGSDGGADDKVPGGAAHSETRDDRPRRNRPAQRDKRDADEDDDVTVNQGPAPGPTF